MSAMLVGGVGIATTFIAAALPAKREATRRACSLASAELSLSAVAFSVAMRVRQPSVASALVRSGPNWFEGIETTGAKQTRKQ